MKITQNVTWVGKIDFELKQFHGSDFSTHRGSSYNSYLIQEEKTVLIDTVWLPYAAEFVRNLETMTELSKIDYIIVNHGEVDHSGALCALMERIPETPIYCTLEFSHCKDWRLPRDWQWEKAGVR